MSKRIVDIDDQTYDMIRLHCILSCDQREALMNAIEIGKPYDDSGDLISREALREKLKERYYNDGLNIVTAIELIDNAPTVQAFTLEDMQNNFDAGVDSVIGKYDKAEGEWINQGDGFSWVFKCSCCGWVDGYPLNERHKYCPNCGADMQKGGAE